MGAVDFRNYYEGKNANEAFNGARDLAKRMNGFGGYTGTIAEKQSFVPVSTTPLTYRQAFKLAEKMILEGDARIDDKWGPAGMIEVKTSSLPESIRKTRKAGDKCFVFFGWASY